jgi:hypothetical protein
MKKEVKKPSAAPIWAFSIVWVAWSLFAPMYRLWHFLLCLVLSAAAAVVCSRLFPPKIVVVEVPDPAPDTGNAALDQVLLRGREQLAKIEAVNEAIPDEKISAQLDELASLTREIFREVQEAPEKLPQIRRFMDYYLPTTLSLLEKYEKFYTRRISGDNSQTAMEQIAGLLDKILVAFRHQLDTLFAADVMDITAEIQVMEQMLKTSGLTDQKDFETLKE